MGYYRKKTYRKKRRYKKRTSYVNTMNRRSFLNPFPHKSLLGNKLAVKLKYNANFTLQAEGTGQPESHILRTNGLVDPDFTSGGHQPRGFDEIMPLYRHFTVVKSTATAWFAPAKDIGGTADGLVHMCGIAVDSNNVVQPTIAAYLEGRNVRYRCCGNSTAGLPISVSNSYTPGKYLAIKNPLGVSELKGDSTTDPTEGVFYHVFIAPLAFAVSQGLIMVNVSIDYWVIFTEPNLPSES